MFTTEPFQVQHSQVGPISVRGRLENGVERFRDCSENGAILNGVDMLVPDLSREEIERLYGNVIPERQG